LQSSSSADPKARGIAFNATLSGTALKALRPILRARSPSYTLVIRTESPMSTTAREKFSSQAAPEVLAALRQIPEARGRQFQSVLDEAQREHIDRQQKERPGRHVMTAFASSLDELDSLYRELAK
jgi:hypothetical protein